MCTSTTVGAVVGELRRACIFYFGRGVQFHCQTVSDLLLWSEVKTATLKTRARVAITTHMCLSRLSSWKIGDDLSPLQSRSPAYIYVFKRGQAYESYTEMKFYVFHCYRATGNQNPKLFSSSKLVKSQLFGRQTTARLIGSSGK